MTALLRPDGRTPGPMGLACTDIRLAGERFAVERAADRGRTSLLRRSDEILGALEALNLHRVTLVPNSQVEQLAALVADLPFAFPWPIGRRISPSAAIDVVFDVQDDLLRSLRGAQPEDGELLEMAS